MTVALTYALAQLNPAVGDPGGNAALVLDARKKASHADLLICPELTLSGYPPEDLVLKPSFIRAVEAGIDRLARATAEPGPALLAGAPWMDDGVLRNAALLLDGGHIAAVRFKRDLPNYGVFDEKRVFHAGDFGEPVSFRGVRLGVLICEDMWTPDMAAHLAARGADILVALNASPFEAGKEETRFMLAAARVRETRLPLIYVNQAGGQDELVFDGGSFALDRKADPVCRLPSFQEALEVLRPDTPNPLSPLLSREEHLYAAMTLGLRDYVNKNRFPGVILGLSGGIDSALSAAIAVDALGKERVRAVMMPSRYTAQASLDDAAETARLLGVSYEIIEIESMAAAFADALRPLFAGRAPDVTEENIQSRIRAVILMALSNKFGHMVLTTGNKSELSTGYATLYGDMCGGFNVLKDVWKTTVFALARWRNAQPGGPVMTQNTIEKPPSAELRPDQKDEDSLPPYPILDDILECLVEKEMAVADVIARGHDAATVEQVENLLYLAEYKRRQAPPGVKLTAMNFGRDRRYPITNRFRDRIRP